VRTLIWDEVEVSNNLLILWQWTNNLLL